MTTDQFIASATAAMEARLGSTAGKTYAAIVFGASGLPGEVDNAHLVAAANNPAVESMGPDSILNLVSLAARGSFAAKLEAQAAPVLAAAGVSAADVAQAAALIAGGTQYIPADPNTGVPDMGVLVTRTPMNNEFHFKVQCTAPMPIQPAASFIQIPVYGFQIGPNGSRTDLPPGTFPTFPGNWVAGSAVTIEFDSPTQFCDAGQGWHLHFEMWTGAAGYPSPNLLSGAPA